LTPLTPATYIGAALLGGTVGASLCILSSSVRSGRRIADLEDENRSLHHELALTAHRPPARPNGHGRHRQDTMPPPPAAPLHAHIADDLTQPIPRRNGTRTSNAESP
jgi:hypothetical protein